MMLTLVAPLFQSPGHGDDVDTGPSPFSEMRDGDDNDAGPLLPSAGNNDNACPVPSNSNLTLWKAVQVHM